MLFLQGWITALCRRRRRRSAFSGRGSRGRRRRRGNLGRFRASSSPYLVGAWRRRIGDEVGWEDVLKGDSAIVSLSLSVLRLLLLLLRFGGGAGKTGIIARRVRRVGVRFAIHFVD